MSRLEYLSDCIKLSAWYILPLSLIAWQGFVIGILLYIFFMKMVESAIKLLFN